MNQPNARLRITVLCFFTASCFAIAWAKKDYSTSSSGNRLTTFQNKIQPAICRNLSYISMKNAFQKGKGHPAFLEIYPVKKSKNPASEDFDLLIVTCNERGKKIDQNMAISPAAFADIFGNYLLYLKNTKWRKPVSRTDMNLN